MDRATLEQRLAEAEQRVTLGESCIERMRSIVAELERAGHDCTHANQTLDILLDMQAARLDDCDRLSKRLKFNPSF